MYVDDVSLVQRNICVGFFHLCCLLRHMPPRVKPQIEQEEKQLDDDFNRLFSPGTPRFGLDSINWIPGNWQPDTRKAYIFKVSSALLSHKIYGKLILRDRKYSTMDHPKDIEHQVLLYICRQVRPLAPHLFPHVLKVLPIGIYNRSLCPIPLYDHQNLGHDMLHEDCVLVMTRAYDSTLYQVIEAEVLSVEELTVIIFQICWMLMLVQCELQMVHRDFHTENILLSHQPQPPSKYKLDYEGRHTVFTLPATGITPVMWDVEGSLTFNSICHHPHNPLGSLPDIDAVPTAFNAAYDLHFFLMCLLDLSIPPQIRDWIISLYPPELVPQMDGPQLSSVASEPPSPPPTLGVGNIAMMLLQLKYQTPVLEDNLAAQEAIETLMTVVDHLSPAIEASQTKSEGAQNLEEDAEDAEDLEDAENAENADDDETRLQQGLLPPQNHYLPDDTHETWLNSDRPRDVKLVPLNPQIPTEYLYGSRLRHKAMEDYSLTLPTPAKLLMESSLFDCFKTKTGGKRKRKQETKMYSYKVPRVKSDDLSTLTSE